MISVGYGLVVE